MMAQFEKLVHMGDLKRFGVEIEGVWNRVVTCIRSHVSMDAQLGEVAPAVWC
jgi:hypothetical protein